MISKNKSSFILSLMHKKFRDEHRCFVAEGTRLIRDLHTSFTCRLLVVTEEYASTGSLPVAAETIITDEKSFARISAQKQPQGILAVYEQRTYHFDPQIAERELVLALENIQDPGNLGTLLRIADWFGIQTVVCTKGTVDLYNPKVVQATMGALSRVNVHYLTLSEVISSTSSFPVYGTFLDGISLYEQSLGTTGIIIMGNEGNGISPETEKLVTSKLLIPSFPAGQPTSESLNVGVAAAIVCAEFRRRMTV